MNLDLNLAKSKSGMDIPINAEVVLPKNLLQVFGVDELEECKVELVYRYTPSFVLVKGQGSVNLTGNCFRCGEVVNKVHNFEFEEKFLPANLKDSQDDDAYQYSGNTIDTTRMIEDSLLITLPAQYLCSEECKGLCPHCFVNLNTQTCACKPLINNAFACLNDIKID